MQYDLVIVGGGIVGATLAVALQKLPLKIALIDKNLTQQLPDGRLIALNDNSIALFEHLGVWPAMLPQATPIKTVHVSKQGYFGSTRIDASTLKLAALGYVVPAETINRALYQALTNITLLQPAELASLHAHKEGVELSIKEGEKLQTYLSHHVVAADGSFSKVRELLQIPTKITHYHQSALVAEVTLKRHHHYIAYERFQDQGAIAMLPLVGTKVAMIWTGKDNDIHTLLKLNDEAFLASLQKWFGLRLGTFAAIGKRHIYPLKMLVAEKQKHKNIFLLGNAAHTFHPIAAQGLNLSLREIAVFVELYHQHGHFSFDFEARKLVNVYSQSLSHFLPIIFSADFFAFNAIRQMAMIGLDAFDFAKKYFSKVAMGKVGRIPKMMLRE